MTQSSRNTKAGCGGSKFFTLHYELHEIYELNIRNYEQDKIEHAAIVIREIKAELNEGVIKGVIKDYEMQPLCNMQTAKETGFAVILTLNTKYDYTSKILDDWSKRMDASYYTISVMRNQLRVIFKVKY